MTSAGRVRAPGGVMSVKGDTRRDTELQDLVAASDTGSRNPRGAVGIFDVGRDQLEELAAGIVHEHGEEGRRNDD